MALVTLTLSSNKNRYMSKFIDFQFKNKYIYTPNNVSVYYRFSFTSHFMSELL